MAAKTVEQQLKQSVEELANLNEDQLEIELGRRLQLTAAELKSQPALSTALPLPPQLDQAELAGPIDFLQGLGKRFLGKLNRQMYELVCNPDDPDNGKVKVALDKGTEGLGYVLAGVLATTFGLLPAIAGVVGTILARRVLKAGHQALCETWQKQF
jgi:hypothetical protein